MKYRKLFDGKKVSTSPVSVQMTIDSECPKKWAFVDMETGDIWVHKSRYPKLMKKCGYTFYVIDQEALDCMKKILESERYE